ncbi:deoxyribonuclease [Alishewanella longhuensis]|uniref:Deoxyribonuclease n=1 Tax=Alishewanella longhuensis TaxID=1091037 RepID=A0ABQ3L390_9ALTE|nr:TatD family hydrolase [Alishewanella longhuensis]GHG68725.1 deoxyribonuclease [Alishewanella longhuensis]
MNTPINTSTSRQAVSNDNLCLFDTHCHLNLAPLATEPFVYFQQAVDVGVNALLIPAVEQANWQRLLVWRQQQANWHIALGVHPWWADAEPLTVLTELERLLQTQTEQIAAVGEIGLDFALAEETFAKQQQFFSAQLALAKQYRKPVILHHRKSQPALLAELKRQQFTEGGILHAFSGSQQQAMAFIDLGFKLGIGGTITYPRSEKTRNAVTKLPLSALVLETDAPAMPLNGFQGQANTPAQLLAVFNALSELRVEPAAQLAAALWQNSHTVLRL